MVSPTTRAVIWAKSAGRCQYPGCNKSQIGDLISGNEDANFGFIAHIVAEKATGPRGDPVRSPLLRDDTNNLMLLCYTHHKLIDVDELDKHSEALLLEYKAQHEDRIETVTDIVPERASHMLLFGAKIGEHASPLSYERCRIAMLPQRYPAERRPITIQIMNAAAKDWEPAYWQTELDNLRRRFDEQVRPRIARGEISHLSVFGLAPIPLLVELGSLLGDITPAEVYQLHREPAGWIWAKDSKPVTFRLERPSVVHPIAAVTLSVSGTINPQRVYQVLGQEVSIWNVLVDQPHNDLIRDPADLRAFREIVRRLYDEIKSTHAGLREIHIFPALPVSTAIEVGRTRMPKADLPLITYDETQDQGFVRRAQVG